MKKGLHLHEDPNYIDLIIAATNIEVQAASMKYSSRGQE
jgi:hypothetical protein